MYTKEELDRLPQNLRRFAEANETKRNRKETPDTFIDEEGNAIKFSKKPMSGNESLFIIQMCGHKYDGKYGGFDTKEEFWNDKMAMSTNYN